MHIDKVQNGHDLVSEDLFIAANPGAEPGEIVARPRIGVDYAGAWVGLPLRYYLKGNPFVSRL
jgi:DNA-3-methyladenine glycosylase